MTDGNGANRIVRAGTIEQVVSGDADLAVFHGGQLDLFGQLPDCSVEAVITDPPYYKKYKQTYIDCYDCSARVLRPHGDLLMIMAHYWLDPFDQMTLKHDDMRCRWTLAMNQSSGGFRGLPNGHHHLAVTYKPIGWWYKFGRRPDDRAGVVDSYQNPPPIKGHKWEQSPAWANFCIDHLYFTQGIIVDPMVGSGTLAVEFLKQGYRAIVGDADAAAVEMTIEKVRDRFAEIRGSVRRPLRRLINRSCALGRLRLYAGHR